MLKRDEPYHDLGADWHTRLNDQAHTRRLVAQLERLGHIVIIDPASTHRPIMQRRVRARRRRSMPCGRIFTGLCGTSDLEIEWVHETAGDRR